MECHVSSGLPNERLFERYDRMLRIPSMTGEEENIAAYIKDELEAMGLSVEVCRFEEGKSPSLLARLAGGEKGAPSLLFAGHIDTVAVTEGWETDPFTPTVDGDKVYALGAMDMKGGVAAILEAVNRFVEAGGKNRGDLIVALAADEENLSRGTHEMLRRGLKADMAIMAECRFAEMAIGFRGRVGVKVVVKGLAAHAAHYPKVGRNAVLDAAKLVLAVESLPTAVHPEFGSGAWCARYIGGGVRDTLTVPDRCELYIDRYLVPGETLEGVIDQVRKAAEAEGIGNRVEIEPSPRPTPFMRGFVIPREHAIVQSARKRFKEVVGEEPTLRTDPSVCDSNYLTALGGIPTLTFGPSGMGLHAPNEYGSIQEIRQCVEIYLGVIEDIIC